MRYRPHRCRGLLTSRYNHSKPELVTEGAGRGWGQRDAPSRAPPMELNEDLRWNGIYLGKLRNGRLLPKLSQRWKRNSWNC